VMPLRDAFVSVFFVSLGMFFDLGVVLSQPGLVLVLTVGFIFGKGFLATAAAMAMRFPSRVAWLAGVGLAQFGEFGFVLSRLAQASGVIDAEGIAPILSAGIVSMFLTPLLVRVAPSVRAGERLLLPLEKLLGVRSIDQEDAEHPDALKQHVVVVGYGLAGQTITKALKACGEKYVVLELNAETVRAARARGAPEALQHAHLVDAKALLLVLNDPPAALRIVDAVKRVAPGVPVLMRARYLKEADALKALGAQDVVAEEVEASIELLARVLRLLQTPRNVIEARVKEAREATHTSERKPTFPRPTLGEMSVLSGLKIESVLIEVSSPAIGKSPVQLDLRKETGALVVAVSRAGALMPASPSTPFEAGDVVFLSGEGNALRTAVVTLTGRS
jgi:monovalent cation:H+ antiporter-2, CPA2 family